MKQGPLIFLGVFGAVLAGWLGTVIAPHFQLGNLDLIALDSLGIEYPLDRAGEAKQGAQVYRAQGCNYCHTQQVLQEPLLSSLTLTDSGTNVSAVAEALRKVRRELDDQEAMALVQAAPREVLSRAGAIAINDTTKLLTNAGARVESRIANLGPDLRRNWGTRRTVARDYLRDRPVHLGMVRFGPDLANVGARYTNSTRLLLKLYNARIEMPGSTMPRYGALFETRKLRPGQEPSPEALVLPEGFGPPAGYEIVPQPAARQLVAYLQSLRSDTLFYEVFPPALKPSAAPANASTNLPSAASNVVSPLPVAGTNAAPIPPATNSPARP